MMLPHASIDNGACWRGDDLAQDHL